MRKGESSNYPKCPECKTNIKVIKSGKTSSGKQRFSCHNCRHKWTPGRSTPIPPTVALSKKIEELNYKVSYQAEQITFIEDELHHMGSKLNDIKSILMEWENLNPDSNNNSNSNYVAQLWHGIYEVVEELQNGISKVLKNSQRLHSGETEI